MMHTHKSWLACLVVLSAVLLHAVQFVLMFKQVPFSYQLCVHCTCIPDVLHCMCATTVLHLISMACLCSFPLSSVTFNKCLVCPICSIMSGTQPDGLHCWCYLKRIHTVDKVSISTN